MIEFAVYAIVLYLGFLLVPRLTATALTLVFLAALGAI